MGLGLGLGHFGCPELTQGSAGVPRLGIRLGRASRSSPVEKGNNSPAKAEERMEGGEAGQGSVMLMRGLQGCHAS